MTSLDPFVLYFLIVAVAGLAVAVGVLLARSAAARSQVAAALHTLVGLAATWLAEHPELRDPARLAVLIRTAYADLPPTLRAVVPRPVFTLIAEQLIHVVERALLQDPPVDISHKLETAKQ